jgi:hypothetical protein
MTAKKLFFGYLRSIESNVTMRGLTPSIRHQRSYVGCRESPTSGGCDGYGELYSVLNFLACLPLRAFATKAFHCASSSGVLG